MKSGRAETELADQLANGATVVALDVVDTETLQIAGRLIWESDGQRVFAAGSQGVEYALIAHWRTAGLIAPTGLPPRAGRADRMVVASGSCSPVTAEQIAWARDRGFLPVPVDAAKAVDEAAWAAEVERAVAESLHHLSLGSDPILFTASGPDDPAVDRFREAVKASGMDEGQANARVGDGLGRAVDRIIRAAGIDRAVIAGGDTSSHAARTLSVFALTAMAPTVPGAALFKAHSEDPALAALEIALKGGQMGSVDYFGLIREGGSA